MREQVYAVSNARRRFYYAEHKLADALYQAAGEHCSAVRLIGAGSARRCLMGAILDGARLKHCASPL
jgi:hypothetical protein